MSIDFPLTAVLLAAAGGLLLSAMRPTLADIPPDPLDCGSFGCRHQTAEGAIFHRAMRGDLSLGFR